MYTNILLFMIYSHFSACLPKEVADHKWWAAGFAYRVLQQCLTMPTLPPSAHWPLGASSVEVGCSELQHQSLPGSADQSHSLCSQWSVKLESADWRKPGWSFLQVSKLRCDHAVVKVRCRLQVYQVSTSAFYKPVCQVQDINCVAYCILNTLQGLSEPRTLPWHWAPHGSWAPLVEERCQFSPQHQYGHCPHLWGRRLPSMRQTKCPYHWDGATGSEMEAPAGTIVKVQPYCW